MRENSFKEIGRKPNLYSVAHRLKGGNHKAPVAEQDVIESLAEQRDLDLSPPPEGSPADLLYRRAHQALKGFFLEARNQKPPSPEEIGEVACEVVENIMEEEGLSAHEIGARAGQSLFLKALLDQAEKFEVIDHSIDVAAVATKLAALVGYPKGDLQKLAFAALLHNIGMIFVWPLLIMRRGSLWPDEMESVRKHSEMGAKFMRNLGPEYYEVADVIWQVHEREDGSGYPMGLKGAEIVQDAKIIGLTDVYTALINPRPYREAFDPLDAMQEIVVNMKGQFDRDLVQALWRVISILFLGKLVKLNTGWIARIVEADGGSPLKPTVELLLDTGGKMVDPPRKMDLTACSEVSIKRIISL